jgi:hypothetical protein
VDADVLKFQLYAAADGRSRVANVYRHNGRLAVGAYEFDLIDLHDDADTYDQCLRILSANLTATQARRWHKLLDGRSIDEIAAEEGVSRTALYVCIRGKDGRGGMVRKNRWVKTWWDNRQLARHE